MPSHPLPSPHSPPSLRRLQRLGYQPQLKREFRLLTSLAISFTIVSVLTGLTGAPGVGVMRTKLATPGFGLPREVAVPGVHFRKRLWKAAGYAAQTRNIDIDL